ncbi:hypothetical protein J6590_038337 [Homalodisca vitripennis]|nr:hypothetical protein J6590_038337 [Homalodisca vitripennis]
MAEGVNHLDSPRRLLVTDAASEMNTGAMRAQHEQGNDRRAQRASGVALTCAAAVLRSTYLMLIIESLYLCLPNYTWSFTSMCSIAVNLPHAHHSVFSPSPSHISSTARGRLIPLR